MKYEYNTMTIERNPENKPPAAGNKEETPSPPPTHHKRVSRLSRGATTV